MTEVRNIEASYRGLVGYWMKAVTATESLIGHLAESQLVNDVFYMSTIELHLEVMGHIKNQVRAVAREDERKRTSIDGVSLESRNGDNIMLEQFIRHPLASLGQFRHLGMIVDTDAIRQTREDGGLSRFAQMYFGRNPVLLALIRGAIGIYLQDLPGVRFVFKDNSELDLGSLRFVEEGEVDRTRHVLMRPNEKFYDNNRIIDEVEIEMWRRRSSGGIEMRGFLGGVATRFCGQWAWLNTPMTRDLIYKEGTLGYLASVNGSDVTVGDLKNTIHSLLGGADYSEPFTGFTEGKVDVHRTLMQRIFHLTTDTGPKTLDVGRTPLQRVIDLAEKIDARVEAGRNARR